jgi:hypothetical protein
MCYACALKHLCVCADPDGSSLHVPVAWNHGVCACCVFACTLTRTDHLVNALMLLYSYLICLALTCCEEASKLFFFAIYDRVPSPFHHTSAKHYTAQVCDHPTCQCVVRM